MRNTLYNPTRAARKAAAKALRLRVRRAIAPAVVRYRNGATTAHALAAGQLVTITTYLTALGADPELLRRFASQAGKKVKAAHLELTGTEPRRVWTVRNGLAVEVFAYPAGDPALRAGLRAYPRTAHLIPA